MHEIIFYEDAAGNKPVLEFIQELRSKNGKDARIRLNKVLEYIKVLETSGTAAGEPYTKHLDGDIYELRPISDRIFFLVFIFFLSCFCSIFRFYLMVSMNPQSVRKSIPHPRDSAQVRQRASRAVAADGIG
mgnify:CR=1 FL=1